MRNWFLEKSIAVRAAIIVLAAAVVTAIGAGVYMLASRASGSNSEVAEITESLAPLESPVITEEKEEEETVEAEEPAVAVVETKETEEIELVDLAYYEKTSNKLENGNFADKLNAWEVYSYVEDNIDYTADDGVFEITMQETGTEDWHVQLKQNSIRLEKGKWYTITFDAKSTLGRSITCAMQRDGMIHNDDWTPYANAKAYTLTSNWKTFTYTFQMNENTDNASVFILSLGTINGRKITTEHTISVDNIKLTQLADNWTDALRVGDNLIGNADFSHGSTLWDASVVAPGAATVSFDNNKASFGITNVGTVDWHVQLKQGGIKLASNQGYRLTFDVTSTSARTIKIGFMDTEYVNWYGGGDVVLTGNGTQQITVDFYNSLGADNNALLMVSMGLIDGVSTPAGNITLSNFKLVKCDTVSASAGGNGGGSNPNHVLSGGWLVYDHECSHTNSVYESNGVYNISITNTGDLDWHVQMQNSSITLENGKWYKMSYEAKSSVARNMIVSIMSDGNNGGDWSWYSSGDATGTMALGTEWTSFEGTFKMTAATDTKAIYNFALGKVNGQSVSETHLVSIRNIKIEEVEEPVVQVRDIAVGDQVLADNGVISAAHWSSQVTGSANGTIDIVNGEYVANITDYGTENWHTQISQGGLKIEKGATYEVKLTVAASVSRVIAVDVLSPDRNYDWIGGSNITVGTEGTAAKEYSFSFTSTKETDNNATLSISLGKMEGAANGEFVISGISVVKTAEASAIPTVSPDADHKGEFVINPADYGITNPVGKHIKVTAKVRSTGKIQGGVGGNSTVTNAWADGGYFVTETGAETAVSYTLQGYKDFMKIDFYYIAADVEVYDVILEDVTPVAAQIVSPNSESKGEFVINPADYGITNPVGKHIKVTAKLKSTGKIEGAIGGNSSVSGGWAQSGKYESADGSEITVSYTLQGYVDFLKLDFWYIQAAVEVYNVTVEDVTPALQGAVLEEEPELVGACAEEEEESILDDLEELIADPEDIVAEPEDFIVDGGLDDENAEAAEVEAEAVEENEDELEEVEASEVLEFVDLDV